MTVNYYIGQVIYILILKFIHKTHSPDNEKITIHNHEFITSSL